VNRALEIYSKALSTKKAGSPTYVRAREVPKSLQSSLESSNVLTNVVRPSPITQLFIPLPLPSSPPSASIAIAIAVNPFYTVDFFAVTVAIEPSFAVEPLIAISIASAVEHSIAVAVAVNPFHTINFFAVPVAAEPSITVEPAYFFFA
jgi:hypothetical protein